MSGVPSSLHSRRDTFGLDPAQVRLAERVVAYLAVAALGSRITLHPMLPLGYAVALAALPVTMGVAARYRGARLIVGLAVLATASGCALTWLTVSADDTSTTATAVGQALRILMIGVGSLLLLWARHVVGSRAVVMTYAVSLLLSVALVGVNPLNPWKFTFAVPVTLLLLSLPAVYRRAWFEMGVLLGLGLVSALQDSRSAAAEMLIAGALVITATVQGSRRSHSFAVLVRLALLGIGGFLLLQSALLRGDLGEAARERTMTQIQTSGSVLLGGRPELGATGALLREQPWGYGIGSQPTPTQIDVAKSGMAALGYDPNNGYVENFMFGDGFEVHSVLGNLWLLTGPPGLALALVVGGYVVWGMAHQLARRAASGVLLFLTVRLLWDLAFAPLTSALPLLMLCLALALPERGAAEERSATT